MNGVQKLQSALQKEKLAAKKIEDAQNLLAQAEILKADAAELRTEATAKIVAEISRQLNQLGGDPLIGELNIALIQELRIDSIFPSIRPITYFERNGMQDIKNILRENPSLNIHK